VTGRAIAASLLSWGVFAQAWAQAIFTCVDARGRRLTADRPIAECVDREQRELNPSGTVKRKIAPTLTADERAAAEEKARKAEEERNRQAEEKRRERALLTRYPDKVTHDKERSAALHLVDQAIAATDKSTTEYQTQRARLDVELEFFKNDLSKAPGKLRREIEETEQHIEANKRFVADQEVEKTRINLRFDDELAKLQRLWSQRAGPVTAAASAAKATRP
jgi:hypothetical protein